ncbi:hypothetical protein ACFWM3_14730 [Gottfriedia sp. NPDC058432]|uniref:hypothetical protein n=1 Tax=Gottfriedia sp. NPDC058432 TaxID=3346497 RepID=UPI003666E079
MKKLIVTIAVITMLTGLAGCQTVNDNKGVATAKESETTKPNETQKKESEKVFPYIEMSKQDAINKSSIGLADQVKNFTDGYSAIWYYNDGTMLYFNDAKITKITMSPKIGMTKEKVIQLSWGKPYDINKTTNAYGVTEQWVYDGNKYLYFQDGILETIQE